MSNTATETLASSEISTSQDSSYIPRGPVTAPLSFYQAPEDGSSPFNYNDEPPTGIPRSNFRLDIQHVELNDVRGNESKFSLDVDAFEAVSGISSREIDFARDEEIRTRYYPEVEELLLDHLDGAQKVVLFDHTIRGSSSGARRAPVTRVHVDQTTRSAQDRVRLHSPEEADELLKGRYRIINVWRPLNGPVQSYPLAVCSASTFENSDLVAVKHIYPTRTGETALVRYNPAQQFFYWSGMANDERLFLKCFDSQDGVGQRVPHTAFVDSRTPEGAPERKSIEVRALVYG